MNAGDFSSLDPLDIRIMEALESDARQTYKDIAARLGVSRPTVMSRVQRLLDSGVIRIICWVDPMTMGYKFTVTLSICAEQGRVTAVADRLAACAQVLYVYLCTGRFDIGAAAFFREKEDLASFLLDELGSIPGIGHVEKMVFLQEVKATSRLLTDAKETLYPESPAKEVVNLDELDVKLIRELQTDARQKTSHLAQKLGVSKPTVFRRIQRLIEEHVVQIITAIDAFALGYEGIATIGLKCDPDKVREVADTVASYKQALYVAICAGRYDVLTYVVFRKLSDLRHFIMVELGSIPGLKDIETMIHYKSVKTLDRIPVY